MATTFWVVKYSVWGSNVDHYAWFSEKEQAEDFAKNDYTDSPVRHTYHRTDSIHDAWKRVRMTEMELR